MIWGSCQVPQDSLDRSPGKRHREGSPYAHLSGPHVRSRRASLASISATGTPVAAVPCVLFLLLHIFPTQNLYFFSTSPFFALKVMRNALFGPKPIFFRWKINIFDEKTTFLIKTWHGILILAQGFSLTLPHRQRQRQINIWKKNLHLCVSCFIKLSFSHEDSL